MPQKLLSRCYLRGVSFHDSWQPFCCWLQPSGQPVVLRSPESHPPACQPFSPALKVLFQNLLARQPQLWPLIQAGLRKKIQCCVRQLLPPIRLSASWPMIEEWRLDCETNMKSFVSILTNSVECKVGSNYNHMIEQHASVEEVR